MISVLHTWGTILAAAGGVLGVLLVAPAFKFDGVWKTCLRIAAFVLMLGLSMLLEEQILNSAGISENGSSDSLPPTALNPDQRAFQRQTPRLSRDEGFKGVSARCSVSAGLEDSACDLSLRD
jgi:hypothetical protein